MMESFSTFFERNMKNPLRKQELEKDGIPNYKKWVDDESQKLEPEEKRELRNLSRRKNTNPEDVASKRKSIVDKKFKKLSDKHLTGKTFQDLKLVLKIRNVKIYADQYVTNLKESKEKMGKTVKLFLMYYKDVVPTRGFDIVITNSNNNPEYVKLKNAGSDSSADAYYYKNKIYIDEGNTSNSGILLHEYSHLLADRVSRQIQPILKKEYEKMINSYIFEITGRKSRRKKLEGWDNLELRRKIVEKLGIPDPSKLGYAATNFDEWFASTIEYWKVLPNNKHTYNFKKIFKKIINRL